MGAFYGNADTTETERVIWQFGNAFLRLAKPVSVTKLLRASRRKKSGRVRDAAGHCNMSLTSGYLHVAVEEWRMGL